MKRSTVEPSNRRRAASRAALLDAAATVFARDGFHRATLDAVADEVGLTKGAVYSSFDGKDDLFFALQERRFAQLREEQAETVREAARKPGHMGAAAARHLPFDRVWNLLFLEFVTYAARHDAFRAALRERLGEQRRQSARSLAGLAEGEGSELRLSPERLARVVGALVNGLAIEALLDPEADPQALLADGLDVLWNGARRAEASGSSS